MTKANMFHKAKKLAEKEVGKLKKRFLKHNDNVTLFNYVYTGASCVANKDKIDSEEQEEKKYSSILPTTTQGSELTRFYCTKFSARTETRFVGDVNSNSTRRFRNILDEVVTLTVNMRQKDNLIEHMGRIYVTEDNKVLAKWTEELFVDIMADRIYTKEEIMNESVKIYAALVYSPSQEKKGAITCFKLFQGRIADATEAELLAAEDRHISYLDIITSGMYTELRQSGKVAFAKAVKANARLSQILAPSKDLGSCGNYAIIMDKDGLDAFDGSTPINVISGWADKVTKGFGSVKFMVEAFCGKVAQIRPLGVKGAGVLVTNEFITTLVNGFVKVTFIRSKITPDIQAKLSRAFSNLENSEFAPHWIRLFEGELQKAVILKDKTGKKLMSWVKFDATDKAIETELMNSFANKGMGKFMPRKATISGRIYNDVIRLAYVVEITDEPGKEVEFVTDLNSFKAPVDFTVAARMIALDVSKESSGKTKLSMQMLSTLLLVKGGLEYIEKTMLSNIKQSHDELIADKGDAPKIEDFTQDKFFLGGAMQTGLKHFVLNHDIPAYKSMVQNWVNGQISSIQKLNIYVDGMFERLTADWSVLLAGVEIIGENECFSGAANKQSGSLVDRLVAVFRSPKMGFREFGMFKTLSLGEVKQRIDEKVVNKETAKVLKFWFAHIQPGTLVLPAGAGVSEKVKDLLGGADFDFDGVCTVWDAEFVNMIKNIAPMVVSVIKPKSDNKDEFSVGHFNDSWKMFLQQCFNGNVSIGEWTNMNQLVQLLLFVPFDIAKKLIKREFVANNYIKTYVSPIKAAKESALKNGTVVEITTELTEEIVNAIRNCKLDTKEELTDIIEDLNIVLRGFQERTIDASKTADKIKPLFNLLKNVTLMCIYDKVNVAINWNEATVKAEYDERSTEAIEKEDANGNKYYYFVINDEFHKIMTKAVIYVQELVQKDVSRITEESMGFTPDQIQTLQDTHSKYEKYDADVIYISNRLAEMNSIRAHKMSELQDEKGRISKYDRKVRVPEISAQYNAGRDALKDMIKRELYPTIIDPRERAAYVKYVAMHRTDDNGNSEIRAEGGSKLCQTLLDAEYFMWAASIDEHVSTKAITKLDRASKTLKDGDTIEFMNGVSAEGIIVHESINGEFIYRVEDKKPWIEADITELLKPHMEFDMESPKAVVVKVFPSVNGQTEKEKAAKHAKMMAKLEGYETGKVGLVLKPWKKDINPYDKAQVVVDGEATTLGKFQAPRGSKSLLANLVKNFKGTVSCVNSGEFEREELDEEAEYGDFGDATPTISTYHINLIVAYENEFTVNAPVKADLASRRAAIAGKAAQETTPAAPAAPVNNKYASILAKYRNAQPETKQATEQKVLSSIGGNEYDSMF